MNKATILELAKGFRGRAKNCIRAAKPRVEKALTYAYRDRRTKKRDMRGLAIERVNAGARQYGVSDSTGRVRHAIERPSIHPRYKQVRYSEMVHGMQQANVQLNRKVRYSEMVHGMQQANVQLNRKVLSEIAASEPFTFRALVDLARQTLHIQRPQIPM
ncbi:unnamed protein product [Closterium sp. Naga37s-1]|nr:unnamed protein product [Closterium sp. Naga37s-1]